MLKNYLLVLVACLQIACAGSDSDTLSTPKPPSTFFAADTYNGFVGSVANADFSDSVISFDRKIAGSKTGFSNDIKQLRYDSGSDELYVAIGSRILVFANASQAEGNVRPTRTITSDQLLAIKDIFLDVSNDLLYIARASPDKILVLNNASTVDGNINPSRVLSINFNGGGFSIDGIAVDTSRDILYVLGAGGSPTYSPRLMIYDNASTINGEFAAADRSIIFSQIILTGKVFLDSASDVVYVSSYGDQTVKVFNSASTVNGQVSVSRTIQFSTGTPDIIIDLENDRFYGSTSAGGGIIQLENVSSASGTVTPYHAHENLAGSLRYPAL